MTVPTVPIPSDPPTRRESSSEFVSKGSAFLGGLPAFGTGIQAMGEFVNARADEVEANTLAATAAAATALASANHKGYWSSLSGALAVPATVEHAGKVWLLNEDLPNVATAEPGVHAAWRALVAVGVTRFRIIQTSDNVTAAARDFINMLAPGKTVTLPATPSTADEIAGGVGNWKDTIIDPLTNTINNLAGARQVKLPNSTWALLWDGTTWRRI